VQVEARCQNKTKSAPGSSPIR